MEANAAKLAKYLLAEHHGPTQTMEDDRREPVRTYHRPTFSFTMPPMPSPPKRAPPNQEALVADIASNFSAGHDDAARVRSCRSPPPGPSPRTAGWLLTKRAKTSAPGPSPRTAEWTKRARRETSASDTQVVFRCDDDPGQRTTTHMGTVKKGSGRTGTVTGTEAATIMDAMRDLAWPVMRNVMCELFDVGVMVPVIDYLLAHRDEFNALLAATSSHQETRQLSAVSAVLAVLLDQHARQAVVAHATFPKRADDGKMRLAVVTLHGLKNADTKSDTRRLARQHRPTSIASFPVQTALVFSAVLSLPQLPAVLRCDPMYHGASLGIEPGIWVAAGAIRVPVITTLLTVTTASFGQNDGASAITTHLKAARKVGAAGTVNFQQTLFRSRYCEKSQGRRLHLDTDHRSPAQTALGHYVRFLRACRPIMMRCMAGFFADDGRILGVSGAPVAYDSAAPQSQAMASFLSGCPTGGDM